MGNVDRKLLTQAFRSESIRYRDGGYDKATGRQRQLAYIDGATVIRRLNDACQEWHFEVVAEESRPILDDRNKTDYPTLLMIAHGRLTIPELGTRDGIGVQEVKPNSGVDFNKGHYTDALKKCATLFGVGLELYGEDHEAGDDEPAAQPRQMDDRQRREVETQHQRSTASAPSTLPVTRKPQTQQPDGQDRARANVEEKCRAKGVPVPDGATYALIAENVNKALFAAGKDTEVQTDGKGVATPGAILNALLALPTPEEAHIRAIASGR